jgi:hypothetical protein
MLKASQLGLLHLSQSLTIFPVIFFKIGIVTISVSYIKPPFNSA